MACGKLMQIEDERETVQDKAIDLIIDKQEHFRQTTRCIINQLDERIQALERDNDYIMDWRMKHDNEVVRKKKRKR